MVDLTYLKKYSSPEEGVYLTSYTVYDKAGRPLIYINATHYKQRKHITVDIEDADGGVFSHIHSEKYDYEEPMENFFGINGNYRILGGNKYTPQLTLFFPDKSHERINVITTNANDYRIDNSPFVAYIFKDEMQPSKAIVFKKVRATTESAKTSTTEVKNNDTAKDSTIEDEIIINEITKDVVENSTHKVVETIPSFKSRSQDFVGFINKNLKYPKAALDNQIEGRVIVTCIINQDGKLSDIKVLKGIGYGCDEEALRLIKLSGIWNPAIQDGKKVKSFYTIPINFSLNK